VLPGWRPPGCGWPSAPHRRPRAGAAERARCPGVHSGGCRRGRGRIADRPVAPVNGDPRRPADEPASLVVLTPTVGTDSNRTATAHAAAAVSDLAAVRGRLSGLAPPMHPRAALDEPLGPGRGQSATTPRPSLTAPPATCFARQGPAAVGPAPIPAPSDPEQARRPQSWRLNFRCATGSIRTRARLGRSSRRAPCRFRCSAAPRATSGRALPRHLPPRALSPAPPGR